MFTLLRLINQLFLSRKYELFNYFMKLMVIITYFLNFILLILEINVILYLKCKLLHIYLLSGSIFVKFVLYKAIQYLYLLNILCDYFISLYVSSFNLCLEIYIELFYTYLQLAFKDVKNFLNN